MSRTICPTAPRRSDVRADSHDTQPQQAVHDDGCAGRGPAAGGRRRRGLPNRQPPLAELTEREKEILALMAEDLTDYGIAERVVVSSKTVETHIRHIFQKLDLPTGSRENRRVSAAHLTSTSCSGRAARRARASDCAGHGRIRSFPDAG
jgi:DNA-binding CsgD family transcriptional regulator